MVLPPGKQRGHGNPNRFRDRFSIPAPNGNASKAIIAGVLWRHPVQTVLP